MKHMRPIVYSVNPAVYPPCGRAERLLLCIAIAGGKGLLAWTDPATGAWVTAELPPELIPTMIQGQMSIGGWPVDPVIDVNDLADAFPDIPTPATPVPRLRPTTPEVPTPAPTPSKVSDNKTHTVVDVVMDRTACDTGIGGNPTMTLETTTDAAHHHRFYDNHHNYGISDKDAINETSRHQVSVAERFQADAASRSALTDKLIVDTMRDTSREAAHIGERVGDKVCTAVGAVESGAERRWDTSILYNQGVAVAAETARRESLAQGCSTEKLVQSVGCSIEKLVQSGDASVIQALTSGFGAVALGVAQNTAGIQKSLCEMATALTGTMNTGFTQVALAQAVADKNREVSEKNLIIYTGDKFSIATLAAQNLASAAALEAQKNFAALSQQAAQLAAISDAKAAECCCELKERIHAEGEATRALIQSNELAELRARLARALPAPAPAL